MLQAQPRNATSGDILTGHCIQVVPVMSNINPLLQMQPLSALVATGEKEFAGQLRQLALPVENLYVFCSQFVHVPPSTPVHPCRHMQLVSEVDPGRDKLFSGQLSQV